MRFATLEDLMPETPPPEPNSAPKIEPEPEPKSEKKIPYENLKGIINNIGFKLANDEEMTEDEKLKRWVNRLEWALPLIPDEHQHTKSKFLEVIQNPSKWDYTNRLNS